MGRSIGGQASLLVGWSVSRVVLGVQPDLFSDLEMGGMLVVLVVVLGHLISSMREGGLCFFLHLCHVAHKGISSFDSGGVGEFHAHMGVLSCIKFEGGVVGGGMDVVVVCKLCDW